MGNHNYTFSHRLQVAFKDTDMAGVVHFTNLLSYVEVAEHLALQSIGISAISPGGGFPKVNVLCDYMNPAKFEDDLDIHLVINNASNSSVKWSFVISKEDSDTNKTIAQGNFVTVFIGKTGKPEPLSDDTRKKLSHLMPS